MSDYISRKAAKEAVQNALAFHSYAGGTAASALDKIPAADVRPVVRGRWEPEILDDSILAPFKTKSWKCSECGHRYVNPYREEPYNFCPNCGAEMREEQT